MRPVREGPPWRCLREKRMGRMAADGPDGMNGPDARVNDATLRHVLNSVRTIALVGASAKPERPAHMVQRFLQEKGYRVFPVNPGLAGGELLGAPVFARLAEIPEPVDMVDIFRNSAAAGKVVDEALSLVPRPKVIWMQIGVINEEAAERARAAGLTVIMNRCPKIEYARLFG